MFTVIAIFRNESHILNEWITHYLNEGAESIILVDNDSTDNWQRTLNPRFVGDTRVKFKSVHGMAQQIPVYNQYIKEVNTEWALFVDLDEFMYSRLEYKTMNDYLKTIPDDVSMIRVPWKLFGSLDPEGNIIKEQPSSVIDKFVCYKNEDEIGDHKRINGMETKSFVRKSRAIHVHCHHTDITGGKCIRPSGREISVGPWCTAHPGEFERDALAINHYITQSSDYFYNNKMKRGRADIPDPYDQNYFDGHGLGSTICTELRDKKYD